MIEYYWPLIYHLDAENIIDGVSTVYQWIQWRFQDPTDGGTLVPYCWPYFVGIFSEI